VLSGEGTFAVDGELHSVSGGDLMLVPQTASAVAFEPYAPRGRSVADVRLMRCRA
jgi:hypothetical protein